MPTAGAVGGISLAPPPNKEFYRQEAVKAFQPERRAGEDRRAALQRNHHRVPLRLPIRVRVKSFNLQFEEVTSTINVCRTGVFFYSSHPYSKGVRAFVTLHYVPNEPGSTMELPGTVVRVDSNPGSDARGVAIQLN
ncbi:MAG: PilZ domain-containing protein [Acidobacteria bacterium]|nr:PilZ domain-containing protein [Acidobacteriota bacterium]